MTILNAVEQIKDVFPKLGYNQIMLMLDHAQKEFVSETKLLTEEASLTDIDSNIAWALPDDFLKIYDVRLYNSNSELTEMFNLGLDFDIEFDKIYLKSITSTPLTTIPSSVSSGYIHYYKKPTTLALSSGAVPTNSFDVDDRYDNYIVDRVLQRCFARYPANIDTGKGVVSALNFQAASYHEKQFDKGVRRAKRDNGDMIRDVTYYQHAGKFTLPKRNYSTGGTATANSLQALTLLWNNYVRVNISSGVATVLTPKIGYGAITASVSGSTVTISSSAEFENNTWIDSSNKDHAITSFTSSAITLQFSDISGEFEIEIGDKYAS